ncbi:ABC transporter ATP-binding protein [Brachybacterium huguangmaarense]
MTTHPSPVGAPADAALEIHGLEKSYGPVRAASGISLSAARGAVTAILGPNGAGKSTTIHCATGLLRPDAGTVRVLGQDPWRADADLRSRVGVMIQDGGLASGAKAMDLLRYAASLYADPLDVDELAAHLGIDAFGGTLVRRLSGGQRQRLGLALAIVGRPELVFLDEPTAGMDAAISRTVRDLLRSLARTGTAVVLTTHLMDDVEGVADHVVVIAHGRVVASGSPESVVAAHRSADGTVHLSATAAGLDPAGADELARELRETAARRGVELAVTTGAADLESVLLDLTAEETR